MPSGLSSPNDIRQHNSLPSLLASTVICDFNSSIKPSSTFYGSAS